MKQDQLTPEQLEQIEQLRYERIKEACEAMAILSVETPEREVFKRLGIILIEPDADDVDTEDTAC